MGTAPSYLFTLIVRSDEQRFPELWSSACEGLQKKNLNDSGNISNFPFGEQLPFFVVRKGLNAS